MGTALEVRDLRLSLGGHEVLSGVSFSVEKGEYCSVIGPNGAGKSTLLKCLNRLHERWTGEILIGGRSVKGLSQGEIARAVGYVPQFHEIPPDYGVEEFLRMSRYARPDGAAQEQAVIDRALAQVGMEAFRWRSMRTLSGGECQKVFLAAGLVQEAPLLLLDEPGTFLDPRYQNEVNRLLLKLNREDGVTILCVSHDLNSALMCSQRLLALKEGRVAYHLPPAELLAEGRLEALYGTTFTYTRHPVSGAQLVVPSLSDGDGKQDGLAKP